MNKNKFYKTLEITINLMGFRRFVILPILTNQISKLLSSSLKWQGFTVEVLKKRCSSKLGSINLSMLENRTNKRCLFMDKNYMENIEDKRTLIFVNKITHRSCNFKT